MKRRSKRCKAATLIATSVRMSWAERIAEDAKSHKRRYEHLMHALYCHGEYDHLVPRKEAAERRARCKKICGLCRYINSLAVWPVQNYRRPPYNLLDALEEQRRCLSYRSIKAAWPSAYWEAQLRSRSE